MILHRIKHPIALHFTPKPQYGGAFERQYYQYMNCQNILANGTLQKIKGNIVLRPALGFTQCVSFSWSVPLKLCSHALWSPFIMEDMKQCQIPSWQIQVVHDY